MIRRMVASAIAVSALILSPFGSIPANALGSRLRAPSIVSVPSEIDATGSRDVTAELNTFLASRSAGTTIAFPARGRYRIEGVVIVSAMTDVTIEGHGSTLFATTDGRGGPPPFFNYRLHWPRLREHVEIRDSERVTVKDLVVEGPNRDGTFRPELEGQAGFVVSRSRNVTLDGVTARATYGDGVYVVGGSVDVTIRRCVLDHNGRQGVAVVDGDNVTVENCTIRATARSVIDLEPAHGLVRTVHVRNNRIDGYVNFLLAAVGAGTGVQDVWLENNQVKGGRGVSVYVGTERSTRTSIHVIGNRGDGSSRGYEGTLMRFTRFDGIEVRDNVQQVAAGTTPVLLHNSCNATISGNDFGAVSAPDVVKSDGDCTTGPPAKFQTPSSVARGPRVPRSTPTSRGRIGRSTTTTSLAPAVLTTTENRTSWPLLVTAAGIGVVAGIGATLGLQRRRRRRTSVP
ncbi:MAG: right-handed parallel beta-helix repeat-containing protein [Acidimicrobiia bacterium]